jgi:methyl-accepting chemotaxis protein
VTANFWAVLILAVSVLSGGLLAYFVVRGINRVLTQAVSELSEGAEQVASASGQIFNSSQSLAQGASKQAASLEETSASSEEMADMTRKNARNSQRAAAVMNNVSGRVVEANRTLAEMTASMRQIDVSSGKIAKIIEVIDEIAFQTNILALNAAFEAGRSAQPGAAQFESRQGYCFAD